MLFLFIFIKKYFPETIPQSHRQYLVQFKYIEE